MPVVTEAAVWQLNGAFKLAIYFAEIALLDAANLYSFTVLFSCSAHVHSYFSLILLSIRRILVMFFGIAIVLARLFSNFF